MKQQSTTIATLPPEGAARLSHKPARSLDGRGVISVAEPTFVAVRGLADDVANMVDSFSMPDDETEYPRLLEQLPTEREFADKVETLERALSRQASTSECQALIVMLLDGLGCPADAGAKNRVGAMVIALQAPDIIIDGEMQPLPISAEVLAATVARMFRKARRTPLPCELLQACMATRTAVANLLHRLRESEGRSAGVRAALQWRISTRHDVVVEEGVNAIPF
jgi:hypothetical protein